MVEPKKRQSTRKAAKSKQVSQRTLLDHFSVRTSSLRSTDTDATIPEQSQQSGTHTEPSSPEVELLDLPPASSSPLPVDIDTISTDAASLASSDLEAVSELPLQTTKVQPIRAALSAKSSHGSTSGRDNVQGKSRDAPILIDASPAKSKNIIVPSTTSSSNKSLFSIFAPRTNGNTRTAKPKKTPSNTEAPYPDQHCQHVRGVQTNFAASTSSLGSRLKPHADLEHRAIPGTQASTTYAQDLHPNKSPGITSADLVKGGKTTDADIIPVPTAARGDGVITDSIIPGHASTVPLLPFDDAAREHYIDTIPYSHRQRPAIESLLAQIMPLGAGDDAHPNTRSYELWTDSWRPRRAADVLGNEERALYLRAWLAALRLHITTGSQLPRAPTARDAKPDARRPAGKGKGRAEPPRGSKRPQVLRRAQKPRKRRKRGDRWIANSSESEKEFDSETYPPGDEEGDDVDDDLLLIGHLPRSRLRRASNVDGELHEAPDAEIPLVLTPPDLGGVVYNSILLVGPAGCGKTAAVYACAEELGWDVFEVYPGIGERSGAALNRLIGEVGKNHLVRQTQRQQQEPPPDNVNEIPVQNHASGQRPSGRRLRRVESDDDLGAEELDSEGEGASSQHKHVDMKSPEATMPPTVSQSLILIEEVDVLFERDTNFWPTLINILKDCRRPVVLTCNDTSLIPVKDLPLQETLTFTPCPVPLATSYLQFLCALERRPVERKLISEMYQCIDRSSLEPPSYPSTVPTSHPDLRRTINRLQFGLTHRRVPSGDSNSPGAPQNRTATRTLEETRSVSAPSDVPELCDAERESLSTLRALNKHRDGLSFADCYLDRQVLGLLQDDVTAPAPAADAEVGYTILRDRAAPERTQHWNPAFHACDQVIAAALARSTACGLAQAPSAEEVRTGEVAAGGYRARLADVMCALDVPAEGEALMVDYDPWVRRMVALDDAFEEAAKCAPKTTGRMTRNSQPERYTRCIALSEGQRRTLRETAYADWTM